MKLESIPRIRRSSSCCWVLLYQRLLQSCYFSRSRSACCLASHIVNSISWARTISLARCLVEGNNSTSSKDRRDLLNGPPMLKVVRNRASLCIHRVSFCLHTVQCSQYLCPDTLDCVGTPSACPCPNEQDIKCLIPDALDKAGATVMCVRGNTECEEVNRLMKKYNKWRGYGYLFLGIDEQVSEW